MRKQARFTKDFVADCFEIMKGRFVSQVAEGFAHLGKEHLGLVAETEQGLCASETLAGADYGHDFVGRHGVGPRLIRIAAEGVVAAVVAAKIGEREKYFS